MAIFNSSSGVMALFVLILCIASCQREEKPLCEQCSPAALKFTFEDSLGRVVEPDTVYVIVGFADTVFIASTQMSFGPFERDSNAYKFYGKAGVYSIGISDNDYNEMIIDSIKVDVLPNSESCGQGIPKTILLQIRLKKTGHIILSKLAKATC